MAGLTYQNISFPFSNGLQTKTDKFQVPAGKLSVLENGVFTRIGQIAKRNGYTALSKTTLEDGANLQVAVAADIFNQDLVMFDGLNVYNYSPANSRWSKRGTATSVNVQTENVVRNTFNQANPDVTVANGIEVYAWEDSRGGVRYSVLDHATRSYLATDVEISDSGSHPKCISAPNGTTAVFYIEDDGVLKYALISVASPSTPLIVAPGPALSLSYQHYDACVIGDKIYLVYSDDATQTPTIVWFDTTTMAMRGPVPVASMVGAATHCINCIGDREGNIWIVVASNSAVNLCAYSTSGVIPTVLISSTLLEADGYVSYISAVETDEDGVIEVYYQHKFNISRPHEATIKKVTYNRGTATASAQITFKRSVGLASKVFRYNSRTYIPAAYQSSTTSAINLQSTYFLIDDTGAIVSQQNQQLGGGLRSNTLLPETVQLDSSPGKYLVAELKQGAIIGNNQTTFTYTGVVSSILDFTSANTYHSAKLSNNLHLVGGVLQMYDGSQVVEHGFLLFPENIATGVDSSGGHIAAGTYQYQVTYEWTDNAGQIHRSTPSIAQTVVVGGGTTSTVTLTIPTLRLTKKTGVRIVVYRTEEIGAAGVNPSFFRVSSIVNPDLNDTTVDSIDFVDTLADASISGNDVIYTTGGILPASCAPNSGLCITYKNRLILAGLEDKNTIWYSQAVVPGEPVSFSNTFFVQCDGRGGAITALGWLDDSLVIFKESAIFIMSGEGPTGTGDQNDYRDPQLIASNVGCVSADSVIVVGKLGIMFQSAQGIWLLSRAMELSYIGSPVEDFNDQTITSAQLVPDTTQVRFVCSDGNAIMYDYFFDQWGTFTNHRAVDAGVWQGAFYFVGADATVYTEAIGTYSDNKVPYSLKAVTGWLSFADLQGFYICQSMMILGDYKGKHLLKLSFAYDFNEVFDSPVSIDTSTVLARGVYGYGTPDGTAIYGSTPPYGTGVYGGTGTGDRWGEHGVYGGTFNLEQFRVTPCANRSSKIQSLKVSIVEDDSSFDTQNAGVALSALNFRVGIKQGQYKVSAGKQFGA